MRQVVWNHETGEPLYNAIVWTDTRTQGLIRKLKRRLGADQLPGLSGLPLSTYPSVGKLLWLLENEPKVKDAYEKGILAFGTIDAWLVYKLNAGPKKNVFVSDPTNASRTLFMNLKTLDYDESLIDFFRLDPAKIHLPKITRSSDPEAYGRLESSVLKGTPITGCLGDQSAALVGQKASPLDWPKTHTALAVSCCTMWETNLCFRVMAYSARWHMILVRATERMLSREVLRLPAQASSS